MKKYIKRIFLIILLNTLMLAILCSCLIFPSYINNPYMYLYNNTKKIKIYEFGQKSSIIDFENNIFINLIRKYTNLYENNNISMENRFCERISLDKRHKRTCGYYSLFGSYKNIDSLKEALNELNIEESEFHSNNLIKLSDTDYVKMSIYIYENNNFSIDFSVYITRYGKQVAKDSIYLDYFLDLNYKNSERIEKELKKAKIKVVIYMILANIIIGSILYIVQRKKYGL